MKILFTGASSFTGYWFVKALADAGHTVVCPVTRALEDYRDARGVRINGLKARCRLVPKTVFGSESFLQLAAGESFDLLCHHAADVTDYKSADFDPLRALGNNVHQLPAVLAALRRGGLRGVVLTGTYFEPDEGAGTPPLRAFSPYSLSKAMTFQYFRHHCHQTSVPLGKFVIPNPFGPFEEPRFTAHLMRTWQSGKPAEVKTPDYRRDNIHVDLLAAAYSRFASLLAATPGGGLKTNPSGYAETQGEFARRVALEVRQRTGWACELILGTQTEFSEPRDRVNTEPAAGQIPDWNESAAWDRFVEYYSAVTG